MRRYNSSATNCVERVAFDHSGCGITFVMQWCFDVTCQPILIEKRPHMLRGAILLRFLSQSIWRIFLPFLNKPRHTSLVNLHVLFYFFSCLHTHTHNIVFLWWTIWSNGWEYLAEPWIKPVILTKKAVAHNHKSFLLNWWGLCIRACCKRSSFPRFFIKRPLQRKMI